MNSAEAILEALRVAQAEWHLTVKRWGKGQTIRLKDGNEMLETCALQLGDIVEAATEGHLKEPGRP